MSDVLNEVYVSKKFDANAVFSTALLQMVNPDIHTYQVESRIDGVSLNGHKMSFSELWNEYGNRFVSDASVETISDIFASKITSEPNPLSYAINAMNEADSMSGHTGASFDSVVNTAKATLTSMIEQYAKKDQDRDFVKEAISASNNRVCVLSRYAELDELNKSDMAFAVFPGNRGGYVLMTVKENDEYRVKLPKEWLGFSASNSTKSNDLPADLTFCHASGFMAAFNTQEGAVKAAEELVKNPPVYTIDNGLSKPIMEMEQNSPRFSIPSKVYVHAGTFHSDDVFAVSLLKTLNPNLEVERVFKVPDTLKDGEIAVDIGGGKYDHHQLNNEMRPNGIPYASIGKLWREIGPYLVGYDNAKKIDESFIQKIDFTDNTGKANPLSLAINALNKDATKSNENFEKAIGMFQPLMNAVIEQTSERIPTYTISIDNHHGLPDEYPAFSVEDAIGVVIREGADALKAGSPITIYDNVYKCTMANATLSNDELVLDRRVSIPIDRYDIDTIKNKTNEIDIQKDSIQKDIKEINQEER